MVVPQQRSSREYEIMDYEAWDAAIESAIGSLQDTQVISRSQQFLKKFPKALSTFRAHLAGTKTSQSLKIPLAEFQKNPTYLLRWLLAEWKDEEAKVFRTDLNLIMEKSTARILFTQEWRAGVGENWSRWGYKDMDDLYTNYKTPADQEVKLRSWFPQRFYGLDKVNHPIHFELLPNTYEEKLIVPMSIRRIINNEHTLRHRIPLLNPAPSDLLRKAGIDANPQATTRPDVLHNPILGATWILDARQLSMWYSTAIWKTGSALIEHANKITSAHYPEQGYRALILNLGVVLGGMYNMAMKVLPATVQSNTKCFVGKDVLEEVMGGWNNVPETFKDAKAKKFSAAEEESMKYDLGPYVIRN